MEIPDVHISFPGQEELTETIFRAQQAQAGLRSERMRIEVLVWRLEKILEKLEGKI